MNQSFHIGSVRGINIRVHAMAVWLLAGYTLWVLLTGQEGAAENWLVGVSMLIALVFLHELGHSVAAQRLGIRVIDITFWPLGGMARMSEIPENSRIEGLIAIAGPAVNFVLAFLGICVWVLLGLPALVSDGGVSLIAQFVFMNLLLGTFNLLPAFPMDGGRVLRAWLGRNGDWVSATEKAVRVGRVIAWLFVIVGLMTWNLVLPLIGIFVWLVGARELLAVRLRHGISPFGRFAPQGEPFGGAVYEPSAPRASSGAPHASSRGFTEADIAQLESFRGRLKRPSDD